MRPKQSFLVVAILLAYASVVSAQIGVLPQKDTTLQGATDEKFKIGDVWEYETRKGEEKSTVTILKVEISRELGAIVHVAVNKVKLANCHGGPSPDSVPHIDRKSTRLNSSHVAISYAVFC